MAESQEAFLKAYSTACPTIISACKAAKINPSTFQRWREEDSAFSVKFAAAKERAIETLEQEAWRRARDGWDEPVYFQGKQVGTVKRYDSTLLIFLLKANNPAKYRDNFNVNFHLQNESPLIQIDQRVVQILSNSEAANAIIEAAARAGTDRIGDGFGQPGELSLGDYEGGVEVGASPGAAEQEASERGVQPE